MSIVQLGWVLDHLGEFRMEMIGFTMIHDDSIQPCDGRATCSGSRAPEFPIPMAIRSLPQDEGDDPASVLSEAGPWAEGRQFPCRAESSPLADAIQARLPFSFLLSPFSFLLSSR